MTSGTVDRGVTLSPEQRQALDVHWRAALHLCAGVLHVLDNTLLKEPLKIEHIKRRLLGHWDTDPGHALIWTHMNRLILARDLDVLFISGPGHGAPSVLAQA